MSFHIWSAKVFLAVFLLATVGCGGQQSSSVTGELSFRGQPIENGSVRFFPVKPTTGAGAVAEISNGRFEIPEEKGLVAGTYMVQIAAVRKTGRMIRSDLADAPLQEEELPIIPAKYNTRSELRMELLPGPNTYDQQLAP